MTPIADRLAHARRETLALIALVEDADLNRSLNPEFSPMRWHLGHVAAFEAAWVLVHAGGRECLSPEYDHLFDPTRTPKAKRIDLPPRSELIAFASVAREESLRVLDSSSPDHPDPLLRNGFVGEMVYQHECQHQEILTFLLQMIPPDRKHRPTGWSPATVGVERPEDMLAVAGGTFRMGASGPGFSYDNEREAHAVRLDDYRIARGPVTELAFARFIEEGGYQRASLWTEIGWRWRSEHAIEAPRDWTLADPGAWRVRAMFEDRDLAPGLPLVGVSQHEAAAFACWAGRRLPTEAEWERAASWDDPRGVARRFPWGDAPPDLSQANVDGLAWGTRPLSSGGSSPVGADDMAGQVWEWTASSFAPYPGFAAFPYAGYSQTWFDGAHRVLRGGSWATRGPLCRNSFRNWYHPHVREIFAGFRLAANALGG